METNEKEVLSHLLKEVEGNFNLIKDEKLSSLKKAVFDVRQSFGIEEPVELKVGDTVEFVGHFMNAELSIFQGTIAEINQIKESSIEVIHPEFGTFEVPPEAVRKC